MFLKQQRHYWTRKKKPCEKYASEIEIIVVEFPMWNIQATLYGPFVSPLMGSVPLLRGSHKCSVHVWPRSGCAFSNGFLTIYYCRTCVKKTLSIKIIDIA